jgi:hypothetical protein
MNLSSQNLQMRYQIKSVSHDQTTDIHIITYPKWFPALSARDQGWDFLSRNVQHMLAVAIVAKFIADAEHNWEGMSVGCMKVSEDGWTSEWTDVKACVYGAITIVLGTLLAVREAVLLIGNYLAPNEQFDYEMNVGRHGHADRKRYMVPEDHLDDLSKAFGTEVRHLGLWNDTTSRMSKRDGEPVSPIARHVYGLSTWGVDMYFSQMSVDEYNQTQIRTGFGLNHDAAAERLQKRDSSEWFHGAWFEDGGIDINVESSANGPKTPT